ncbi:hypothetical protein CBS147333_4072 [Penicillium roqueforti]|nr:hypothetical protein CBS147333_4072 [Penicillium roqueforti]KAI3273753.1 hypothetical protein CBS147308_2901 [Penicillium roqueforti]KAI3292168.1 hypothetical protein DTO003C3_3802 [Penicillium roqueforti]
MAIRIEQGPESTVAELVRLAEEKGGRVMADVATNLISIVMLVSSTRCWEVLYCCFSLVRQAQEGIGAEKVNDISNLQSAISNLQTPSIIVDFLDESINYKTKRICTRSRLSRASPLVRAALPTSGTIHFSGSQGSFSAQRPGAHGYARNIYLGTKFERR